MQRTVEVVANANGASQPVVTDYRAGNAKISVQVQLSPGASLTWTLQYCLEDPYKSRGDLIREPIYPNAAAYNANGFWVDSNDVGMVGETTSATSNFNFPIHACRINVTNYVSGTATLRVVSSGNITS